MELESSSAVGGTQSPWALPAGPGGERSARLGAPGGPAAVQERAGPARGSCRVTFPGKATGRPHHKPLSLLFVFLPEAGERPDPRCSPCAGRPAPLAGAPGVPARTPRPVPSGGRPDDGSWPAPRLPLREPRSPRRAGPRLCRGAPVSGVGDEGFRRVTCHYRVMDPSREGPHPTPLVAHEEWGREGGSRVVVFLRGPVGLSFWVEKLPFPPSLEDFAGCLPFSVKGGKDPGRI